MSETVPAPPVDPIVGALSRTLLPDVADYAAEMAERIWGGIAYYREADGVTAAQLIGSCADNLRYVFGTLAGDPAPDADGPRRTGVVRAEQGVPYAAVLQAYRIGGRYIWELLVSKADDSTRSTLLLAAADIWTVTDQLSATVTDAYRATLADRARRDDRVRSALIGAVLEDGGAEQGWESADMLDLPRQGDFVVVAAECPSPGEEAIPGVEDLLGRHGAGSAWRLDHDHHEGLVALRPGFGRAALVDLLGPCSLGRVGVSAVFPRIDAAPAARREARVAAATVTPGSAGPATYDEASLAVLLAGNPDAAAEYCRRVLGRVLDLAGEDRDALLSTARAWLAESGSTSAAASRLYLHRNTVRYRLKRVAELTGRDLGVPVQAAELHVALECARFLGLG